MKYTLFRLYNLGTYTQNAQAAYIGTGVNPNFDLSNSGGISATLANLNPTYAIAVRQNSGATLDLSQSAINPPTATTPTDWLQNGAYQVELRGLGVLQASNVRKFQRTPYVAPVKQAYTLTFTGSAVPVGTQFTLTLNASNKDYVINYDQGDTYFFEPAAPYTLSANPGETATTICTRFVNAINTNPASLVVATDSGGGVMVLTAKVAGQGFDIGTSTNGTVVPNFTYLFQFPVNTGNLFTLTLTTATTANVMEVNSYLQITQRFNMFTNYPLQLAPSENQIPIPGVKYTRYDFEFFVADDNPTFPNADLNEWIPVTIYAQGDASVQDGNFSSVINGGTPFGFDEILSAVGFASS